VSTVPALTVTVAYVRNIVFFVLMREFATVHPHAELDGDLVAGLVNDRSDWALAHRDTGALLGRIALKRVDLQDGPAGPGNPTILVF
jgi:hypothetical protein